MTGHPSLMARYPTTSKTLLERLRTGDDVPWREFFDRYSPLIRAAGSASGLSDVECDDLVQNVMAGFFNTSKKFVFDPSVARFRTYFARVIRSQIALLYRSRGRLPSATAPPVEAEDFPTDAFAAAFEAEWRDVVLKDALDHLKKRMLPRNYLAFYRTFCEGGSIRETAALLGLSEDQVYAARSRGAAILRRFVRDAEGEGGDDAVPSR